MKKRPRCDFISLRKLCKERYGTNNYSEFRRAIVHNGYSSFKEDLDLIFRLVEDRDILMLPINDNLDDWNNAMARYNLMPNDAIGHGAASDIHAAVPDGYIKSKHSGLHLEGIGAIRSNITRR